MVTPISYGDTKAFDLHNEYLRVRLVSYGARITNLYYAGKDVVLGFDTLREFQESPDYCGAIVGRVGNRISGGKFTLNGVEYNFPKNEKGITTLHGGTKGFDRYEWDAEVVNENAVRFSRISPDGEMGFPGNLTISVTYSLENSALVIEYDAVCDQDTHINVTNHAFFNLDGYNGEKCLNMELQFNAPWYLPVDENLLPTGEIAPVEGTKFDFQTQRPIEFDYDHCFVLAKERGYRKAGTLYSPKSGIVMDMETDLPAMQFYTATRLSESRGKGDIPLHFYQGVALETQFLPDSANHENFPSTLLKAGEKFYSVSKYIFSKK